MSSKVSVTCLLMVPLLCGIIAQLPGHDAGGLNGEGWRVEGFGVDVRLVDVAATAGALTICVTVGDVLAANAALPL